MAARGRRGARQRRADIVRYWRAVEMFSPQKVDRISPQADVYAVEAGRPLPWEAGHRIRAKRLGRNMVWQHTVYCGVYAVADARDVLLEVFGTSEEDHDGRIDGDSALLAFEVTDDGLLVEDSLTFSACGWATGRAVSPGPGTATWLDGFEDESTACEAIARGVGDGRLTIVDRPGGRLRPFAGLACEIVLGAVTGGLGPAVAPLGDIAAGALTGAADVAAEAVTEAVNRALGQDAENPEARDGRDDADGDGRDGGTDDEQPAPRLGEKPLTVRDLAAVTRWVSDRFGVTDVLQPETIRVKSRQISRRKAGLTGGSDFLNSFIAADLALVAGELVKQDPGTALRDYLSAAATIRTDRRVDLRTDPAAVLAGVTPARFPSGRWPARTEHPLVLSQQFAVNAILDQLADGAGLYAVNGPPGTGKTTQLRDLIAAILVRRAERLAELARPQDAFTGPPLRWSTGGYPRTVRSLAPGLTGYEMVIASANNGAVENISLEIPSLDSVDESWRSEAAYFPEQGTLLLDGTPAWGALAARLGNKGNRLDFRSTYWFGPSRKAHTGGRTRTAPPSGPDAPPEGPAAAPDAPPGMRELLAEAAARPPGLPAWRRAVARFRAASDAVERLRAERQRVVDARTEVARSTETLAGLADRLARAEARVAARRTELAAVRHQSEVAGRRRAEAALLLERHRERRPGTLTGLLSLGSAARDWRAEDGRRARAEWDARLAHEDLAHVVAVHEQSLADAECELRDARLQADRTRTALDRHRRRIREAESRWGDRLPGREVTPEGRSPDEARELSSPWSDTEFTAARTRLFLAAMDLHRAFLEGAADRMRKNLDAAMDVVCGDAPPTLPAATVLAAWQNLFLAVPVVSTTFASLDRMFTGLGPDSLGWVLIDEAGQATAQMPVGALWRARRAVLVGDPLQLEPVVTLPHTGQQALRRSFGVAEEWLPGATSAQRVADRLARYGTWLPAPDSEDGRVWVGSPLRVHRRCEDPMFRVSNEIAYEGLMVQGVARPRAYPVARRSVWWHVEGGTADGKWSAAEGEAACVVVHRLVDQGLDPATGLFVISPFRDVVAELRRSLCDAVPRNRIGTVHTTQGKEADVVLLVLGAGGAKAGPRTWAAAAPNLLNVAVSRARRRLFVVGDHEAWRRHPHFDVLAAELPRMSDEEATSLRRHSPVALPTCHCA